MEAGSSDEVRADAGFAADAAVAGEKIIGVGNNFEVD
jgi:hypothetical protein